MSWISKIVRGLPGDLQDLVHKPVATIVGAGATTIDKILPGAPATNVVNDVTNFFDSILPGDVKDIAEFIATAVAIGQIAPDSDIGELLNKIGTATGKTLSNAAVSATNFLQNAGEYLGGKGLIPKDLDLNDITTWGKDKIKDIFGGKIGELIKGSGGDSLLKAWAVKEIIGLIKGAGQEAVPGAAPLPQETKLGAETIGAYVPAIMQKIKPYLEVVGMDTAKLGDMTPQEIEKYVPGAGDLLKGMLQPEEKKYEEKGAAPITSGVEATYEKAVEKFGELPALKGMAPEERNKIINQAFTMTGLTPTQFTDLFTGKVVSDGYDKAMTSLEERMGRQYKDKRAAINEELAGRGLFQSGIRTKEQERMLEDWTYQLGQSLAPLQIAKTEAGIKAQQEGFDKFLNLVQTITTTGQEEQRQKMALEQQNIENKVKQMDSFIASEKDRLRMLRDNDIINLEQYNKQADRVNQMNQFLMSLTDTEKARYSDFYLSQQKLGEQQREFDTNTINQAKQFASQLGYQYDKLTDDQRARFIEVALKQQELGEGQRQFDIAQAFKDTELGTDTALRNRALDIENRKAKYAMYGDLGSSLMGFLQSDKDVATKGKDILSEIADDWLGIEKKGAPAPTAPAEPPVITQVGETTQGRSTARIEKPPEEIPPVDTTTTTVGQTLPPKETTTGLAKPEGTTDVIGALLPKETTKTATQTVKDWDDTVGATGKTLETKTAVPGQTTDTIVDTVAKSRETVTPIGATGAAATVMPKTETITQPILPPKQPISQPSIPVAQPQVVIGETAPKLPTTLPANVPLPTPVVPAPAPAVGAVTPPVVKPIAQPPPAPPLGGSATMEEARKLAVPQPTTPAPPAPDATQQAAWQQQAPESQKYQMKLAGILGGNTELSMFEQMKKRNIPTSEIGNITVGKGSPELKMALEKIYGTGNVLSNVLLKYSKYLQGTYTPQG